MNIVSTSSSLVDEWLEDDVGGWCGHVSVFDIMMWSGSGACFWEGGHFVVALIDAPRNNLKSMRSHLHRNSVCVQEH